MDSTDFFEQPCNRGARRANPAQLLAARERCGKAVRVAIVWLVTAAVVHSLAIGEQRLPKSCSTKK